MTDNFEHWVHRARAVRIEDEVARRGIRLTGKKNRVGPCPKCGGTDRFSINTVKQLFNCRQCRTGGDVIELVKFLDGCEFRDAVEKLAGKTVLSGKGNGAFNGKGAAEPSAPPIPEFKRPQAVFDYKDADSNLLYQNVRFPLVTAEGSPVMSPKGKPDKTFRFRRPNGKGGWVGDLDGVAQIPYRLPDLRNALMRGATVFVPEGEAKADDLWKWGMPATHIAAGTVGYAQLFHDADVILMPDNDDAGYAHIDTIGAALSGTAKRIRVLRLPDLPDRGDVLDWIEAGGTVERLQELAEQAPESVPPVAVESPDPAKKAAADAGEKKLIDELARLSALEYDKQRDRAAKNLGVRKSSLDKEVEGRRAALAAETESAPLDPWWAVEPWPEPVDGDALILAIMRRIQRHAVLTPDQALTVALWIMMAWAHSGAAIYSPILMVTSAEANSGKTTLLGLVGFLVPRSLSSVGVSEAALYRSIERWNPTIIADEFDTLLADNEPLRAVINSGWTRGSGVLRCVGDEKTPHRFPTFCPKVIGLKGRKLPDTTLSRAIIIELKRKKPSHRVEHFRHLDDAEFANLRRQALRWTMDNIATLETAVPKLPAGFDNRIGDNWRLMIAIADLAGGEWPDQARQAASVIAKVDAGDMSIRVQLLADIRDIFATKSVDRIPTSELIAALVDIDSHPWAEWKNGKGITDSGLARLLAAFHIAPGTIRVGVDRTPKGYRLGHFQDAFERYL
jgi:hypothetical protein